MTSEKWMKKGALRVQSLTTKNDVCVSHFMHPLIIFAIFLKMTTLSTLLRYCNARLIGRGIHCLGKDLAE
jgi:hypothetical protein